LLHEQCVIEGIRKKIKSFLKFNENESTASQNLWYTAKPALRGKFMAMKEYIKNRERSQIKDLAQHVKLLEKEEQAKLKTSRREIIKIKAEIYEIRDQNKNFVL
jgi:hypothetical protein